MKYAVGDKVRLGVKAYTVVAVGENRVRLENASGVLWDRTDAEMVGALSFGGIAGPAIYPLEAKRPVTSVEPTKVAKPKK
jgi:hypothetical protein